jgi:hypothetical protein
MSAQPSSRRQFLRHATGAGLGLRLGVELGLGVVLGGAAWLGAGVAIANATAPAARPFQPPAPARWSYAVEAQLRGIPFKADARMEWAHDGERYRASSEFQVPLLGKRRQTSTGRITPAGLLPERFTDESRRLRSVDFDHARGQILYTPGGGGHHGAPLPAGVQDRLSLFLQLAGWLAGTMANGSGHARPEPGSVWTLPVTGRSHAAPWSFEWLAPERLAVPAGAEQAWPLRRQPRNADDETLALWLVPAWGFAPARIEVRETDGDVVNQVLTQRL